MGERIGGRSGSTYLEFLRGLRCIIGLEYGKQISETIPTWSAIQVKKYTQIYLKNLNEGRKIFTELNKQASERQHKLVLVTQQVVMRA